MSAQEFDIPRAILMLAICAVIGSGLFYLGLARRVPLLKLMGVMLVIMSWVAVGIQVGSAYFGWFRPEFRSTMLYQPQPGEDSRTGEMDLPIHDGDGRQKLRLRPDVFGSGPAPGGPVTLEIKIRSPRGAVVLDTQQQTPPAAKNVLRWQPIETSFTPQEPGQYMLTVKAPVAVGSIDVWMRQ
jgi:hypothetical protein